MKRIIEAFINIIVSLVKAVIKLIKSIGLWFWGNILGIFNFFKAIVVGIYKLIFKTTIKQKLSAIGVMALLVGAIYLVQMNDLTFSSVEDDERVIEEGTLVDLEYQRLKEEEKYLTLFEDDQYLARMDLTTTNVEMLNKQNDLSYSTLSPLVSSEALKTPFLITYKLKDSTATQTMNAMTASVNEGTYQVYEITNGVRVDYIVGDSKISFNDLPRFIDPEKFENKILNSVSSESKELVSKYYKYSEDRDVYYPENPRGDVRRVYEIIFYESEYTYEDLSEDIYTYTGEDSVALPKASFTIPIEYVFENGKLNVNVLFQQASFHEEYQIVTMDLLPSFGATVSSDSAYALVPDGSGGIVNLDGVKATNNVYMKSLYNSKELLAAPTKQFDEQATMPIYGITDENQGVFAIIRNGAEKTELVLTVSNNEEDPNRMFPRIQSVDLYNHDFYGDGSTIINYYSENKTSEFSIEYNLLDNSNQDYFSLANMYRDYLTSTFDLEVQDDITSGILVDIIGGIKKEQNVMGVQFDKVEYATTYEETLNILEELNEINNISTIYSGWMNGGYMHKLPTSVSYDKAGGGAEDFEKLVTYINDNELNHFFDIAFIETFSSFSNGFRASEHGLNNVPNEVLEQNVVLPHSLLEDKTSITNYFVAPNYLNSVVDRFLADMQYDLSGLSLRDIGSLYYANYGNDAMEFSEAQGYIEQVLTTLKDKGYGLLFKDGYNYTFPYSSYQTDIPLETTYSGVVDYAIPFKNIVYNGLFDYSGRSVNIGEANSIEKNLLKAVEFGMDVKYTVSHEDSNFFNNTEYSYLYDTKFENLKGEINESSNYIEESKETVGNGHIIGHELLMKDVFKVTYENGNTLIFNYNNESVEVSGRTIPGLGYIVE